jgi:hypothetical protein
MDPHTIFFTSAVIFVGALAFMLRSIVKSEH